ncbi:protein kinase domain-containing protein [Nonomuraea sp. NPDC004297]
MTAAQPGNTVGGRYRLITILGTGGFGRVWRAHDTVLDVEVAIKELRLLPGMSQVEQDKRLERTAREARNAVRLRAHENVVAIHDIVTDDLPWIVMELVDGQSLHEYLDARGPLPVDRAAQVAAALLAALAAAHRTGIVHRDVKPANVMLSGDGQVLLTDFGIAVHTTDTTLTATGMLIGSPEYMAPERLRGVDGHPASDLFSLGVTLYQAVEGVSPFRRSTQPAALTAVMLEEPPPPRQAGRLTPLITRLLDKDPNSRPTIEQALAMLGDTGPVRERTTVGTRVLPPGQTSGQTRRRAPGQAPNRAWQHIGVAVMLGIVFLLALAGLTFAGYAWDEWEDAIDEEVGSALLGAAVLADVAFTGLLCAQAARFVPPVAGRTVAVIVGVLAFLAGCGAAALAFDGLAVAWRVVTGLFYDETWYLASITLTVIMLITGGWSWEARKSRRQA